LGETQSLVKPLTPEELQTFSDLLAGIPVRFFQVLSDEARPESDVSHLLAVMQHGEADRVPFVEFEVHSHEAYEFVLERELSVEQRLAGGGVPHVTAEDQVEFAQRLGLDAIVCHLDRLPCDRREKADLIRTLSDLQRLEPRQSLASHLDSLERHLRAARGTGVGVMVGFPSFYGAAVQATGTDSLQAGALDQAVLEAVMDAMLEYWEQVVRAVCDRFGGDIAVVLVEEDLSRADDVTLFRDLYQRRMKGLLSPAKEHDILVALDTRGQVQDLLPILHDVGFDAVHPRDCGLDDLRQIGDEWAGRMTMIGGVLTTLLTSGSRSEITEQVKDCCARLGPGGGYVLSTTTGIPGDVLPENLFVMAQAVHKHGRVKSLE
jgi:hypothetical protein